MNYLSAEYAHKKIKIIENIFKLKKREEEEIKKRNKKEFIIIIIYNVKCCVTLLIDETSVRQTVELLIPMIQKLSF